LRFETRVGSLKKKKRGRGEREREKTAAHINKNGERGGNHLSKIRKTGIRYGGGHSENRHFTRERGGTMRNGKL